MSVSALMGTARIAAVAGFVVVGLSGCEVSTAVNENPNAPEDVQPEYLLPNVLRTATNTFIGVPFSLSVSSVWVQHVASLEYGYTDRYEFESNFSDGRWQSLWTGPLVNVQGIVDRGKSQNRPNTHAVGLILKSWMFQQMTDVWGDLPYSEALLASDGPIYPKYDTQQSIYTAIISDLKSAQDMINPAAPLFTNNGFDLLYGGNVQNWRRYANSLRLRAGMRLSEVDPAKAQATVASAVADGVFLTAAQEARLVYLNAQPNNNPIAFNLLDRPNDRRISATLVDTLKALQDPRLPIYAAPVPATGQFVGKANGTADTHGIAFEAVSRIGTVFGQMTRPLWHMTLEEVLFLQAEAAQRGWISGNPADLYHEGIRASMRRYGVPDATINAYLAQPRVVYNPARWREQIGLQKWIALFDNSLEAYAEYRRLNFPVLRPGPASANNGVLPLRHPYPALEQNLNRENLAAARQRQNGAEPSIRVWWDVN
jgi:hypothetical protein